MNRYWHWHWSRDEGSTLLELELLNILHINHWPDILISLLDIQNRSVIVDTDVIVDYLRVGPLIDQLIIHHYLLLSSNGRCGSILEDLLAVLDELLTCLDHLLLLLILSKEFQGLELAIQQR